MAEKESEKIEKSGGGEMVPFGEVGRRFDDLFSRRADQGTRLSAKHLHVRQQ
jgi:hypothetical protein